MRRGGYGARALAASVVLSIAASLMTSCSESSDTTQLAADSGSSTTSTSIVIGTQPTTTSIAPFEPPAVSPVGSEATLSALVGKLASDPAVLASIGQLSNMDLSDVARMLGIDTSAIQQLGVTSSQIASLARSISASPEIVQKQLESSFSKGTQIDPAVLVGLLTRSFDADELAQGAVGALVKSLVEAIGKTTIKINPQLNIQLSELIKELDPNGAVPGPVDPQNASLVAILTSALISANPLLAQQLLENPLLDPDLKALLTQLQSLSADLSDVATAALLSALAQLFPGLVPQK